MLNQPPIGWREPVPPEPVPWHPPERLGAQRPGLPSCDGAAEDSKGDATSWVGVAEAIEHRDGSYLDAQLLPDFPPQARFPRLSSFPLAAGKFPVSSKIAVGRPLTDEEPALPFNDGEGHVDVS